MNARFSKCLVSVLVIAALALAIVPFAGAQEGPKPEAVGPAKPALLSLAATATPTGATPGDGLVELVRVYDTSAHPLAEPGGLAVDSQGNLFIADDMNNVIQKYDNDGEFVTQWGGPGSGDGQFKFSTSVLDFENPRAPLSVDKEGNVYAADVYNARVQIFDNNGTFLRQFKIENALRVYGVYVDAQDTVYVHTFPMNTIQKLDPEGNLLGEYLGEDATHTRFLFVRFCGTDSQGNLVITDAGITVEGAASRLITFDANGKIMSQFTGQPGDADGQLRVVVGCPLDSENRLYLADRTSRVQVFDQSGNFLGIWTGPGDGSTFDSVDILTIDGQDNIYLRDSTNIYEFRLLK
ncbi:MAG: hypothetical protein GX573_00110 [Chloroflexi bacterium]|nr:hypothetical protein [Chloroflexota bacterium]